MLCGGRADGAGNRVALSLFHGRGIGQYFITRECAKSVNMGDVRLIQGERPRFIKNDGVDGCQQFQRATVFDQNTMSRRHIQVSEERHGATNAQVEPKHRTSDRHHAAIADGEQSQAGSNKGWLYRSIGDLHRLGGNRHLVAGTFVEHFANLRGDGFLPCLFDLDQKMAGQEHRGG